MSVGGGNAGKGTTYSSSMMIKTEGRRIQYNGYGLQLCHLLRIRGSSDGGVLVILTMAR